MDPPAIWKVPVELVKAMMDCCPKPLTREPAVATARRAATLVLGDSILRGGCGPERDSVRPCLQQARPLELYRLRVYQTQTQQLAGQDLGIERHKYKRSHFPGSREQRRAQAEYKYPGVRKRDTTGRHIGINRMHASTRMRPIHRDGGHTYCLPGKIPGYRVGRAGGRSIVTTSCPDV